MALPSLPTLSTTTFADGAIAIGSRVEIVGPIISSISATTAAASLTSGIVMFFDNITLNYPTKKILRGDQIGSPNGFAIVYDQPTGSATVQVPTTTSTVTATGGFSGATFPKVGDGFIDTFLGDTTRYPHGEIWVIDSVSEPFEQNGYYKANVSLILAHTQSHTLTA